MPNSIHELNDIWIQDHKDHSICWLKHTIAGTKFKECICYTCSQTARELLDKPVVIEKKKRIRKKKREEISMSTT
jgi:hypothetical protein